jgi:hypothetical protein
MSNSNYNGVVPKAPLAASMLPRLTDLQDTDLIYVVRPTNPLGQRSKAAEMGLLAGKFLKASTGWVSIENRSLAGGIEALAKLEVPKGYGGRFEFRFDMQYSDTGTLSPGYVQDLNMQAYDIDKGTDVVTCRLQRIFHDAAGAITGSNAVISTHWCGSVDVPESTRSPLPDIRDIHLSVVLPYGDSILWALQNIKLKAELWHEQATDAMTIIGS